MMEPHGFQFPFMLKEFQTTGMSQKATASSAFSETEYASGFWEF